MSSWVKHALVVGGTLWILLLFSWLCWEHESRNRSKEISYLSISFILQMYLTKSFHYVLLYLPERMRRVAKETDKGKKEEDEEEDEEDEDTVVFRTISEIGEEEKRFVQHFVPQLTRQMEGFVRGHSLLQSMVKTLQSFSLPSHCHHKGKKEDLGVAPSLNLFLFPDHFVDQSKYYYHLLHGAHRCLLRTKTKSDRPLLVLPSDHTECKSFLADLRSPPPSQYPLENNDKREG